MKARIAIRPDTFLGSLLLLAHGCTHSAAAADEDWYPTSDEPVCEVWGSDPCIPQGFHVESKPRRGLLIAGSLSAGLAYVLGLGAAAQHGFRNEAGWLFVPTVGPWITLATREPRAGLERSAVVAGLLLSATGQAAGVGMITVALLDPVRQIAPNERGAFRMTITPTGITGVYRF
jgi:hypothetical protein